MAIDKNDRDDFWDIDKLVPKKRGTLSPFASSDPARDVEIPAKWGLTDNSADNSSEKSSIQDNTNRPDEERKLGDLTARSTVVEEITYTPQGNGLIKSVKINRFIDKYDFYDNFRKSALIYYDYRPSARVEFAKFYSFMPQYSQLNPQQKAYYFFWRTEMEHGRFHKSDYSYVYLYVYEILNLPDKIPPAEGIKLLCRVWREYRKALPRLDLYFAIWVQDYCLVHRLECPMSEIADFIFDIISASSFKEFYISDIGRRSGSGTTALLAYLSDYDWRRGKYAAGDPDADEEKKRKQAVDYRMHMEGAMSLLFRDLWDDCIATVKSANPQIVKRDAFPNSLCTHMVKRKLEIEYYSISSAIGLRTGVTSAVRYTENKIRALMGIRSRLAIKDLPNDYRRIIDYYFDTIERIEQKKWERESAPEYMRLYDAPTRGFSFEGADEIERASWDTTARLVTAGDGEGSIFTTATETVGKTATKSIYNPNPDERTTVETASANGIGTASANNVGTASVNDDGTASANNVGTASANDVNTYGLSHEDIEYLSYLCLGTEYTPTATPPDTLAERINEAFADGFGDVIIEPSEDGYTVIEDYREDITEWLNKITK